MLVLKRMTINLNAQRRLRVQQLGSQKLKSHVFSPFRNQLNDNLQTFKDRPELEGS